ncbi:hypothetical protein NDU88_006666 [Pleurodeles waltl]|uniref:Uncharacterized protein n=1 Tax=Pleurodeles waltl TaxID=8319 RepID=A0AAV7QIM2_PLEWA|nr:hypothetical protein NDU88_006666 [Pleurodeles waltl]
MELPSCLISQAVFCGLPLCRFRSEAAALGTPAPLWYILNRVAPVFRKSSMVLLLGYLRAGRGGPDGQDGSVADIGVGPR